MTVDIGKNTVDLNIDLFDNAAGSDTQNRRSGRAFINRQQAGIGNRPDRIAGQLYTGNSSDRLPTFFPLYVAV